VKWVLKRRARSVAPTRLARSAASITVHKRSSLMTLRGRSAGPHTCCAGPDIRWRGTRFGLVR
jgi:hypothetical protein